MTWLSLSRGCNAHMRFSAQAGAIHDKICAIVQSIAPAQQQQQTSGNAILQSVLAAIAEHAVLALSRLLKSAAAASPPVLLLSAPTLTSLVHIVAGGLGDVRLSVIGARQGLGFARSAGLLDAGSGLGMDLRGDVCVKGCIAVIAAGYITCSTMPAAP